MTSRRVKIVLLGFALGCAMTACPLIGNGKIALYPSLPGAYIVLVATGSAWVPSFSVCLLNGLCYAVIAFLVALFLPKPRIPVGHCQDCSYNLTGLPEPRCPECGAEFEVSTVKD